MKHSTKFIAAAFVCMLTAPLRADEGAFLKELEKGRQELKEKAKAGAEARKCPGGCRRASGEAKGALPKGPWRSVLKTKSSVYELRGQAPLSGTGPVYSQADPHWFYGTAIVSAFVKLNGKDGVYGTVELSGDIYVSGSGHRATGPVSGHGAVSGEVRLFTKEGAPLPVFRVTKPVSVFGSADGHRAAVGGTVVFE